MPVIGVLTAGGDCPGLNAVIRAVVGRAESADCDVVGVLDGWKGLMEGDTMHLNRESVRGIIRRGGTMLGTSRMDPYVHGDGWASVEATVQRTGIDTLVVIGGDGTLRTALDLSKEGLRVIGVPKTIDNDISATDTTFGFDTAVHVATEAIDRIATTAEAHERLGIVEVMGRHQGWIALYAGIAGGADAILIPETPYDLEEVAATIKSRARHGLSFSIIVVAEGVAPPPQAAQVETRKDAFGFDRLGGVAYQIAPVLEDITGFESRVTVLGHIQRGGVPTSTDRVLATRLGYAAADLAISGANQVMTAVRGDAIVPVSLEEACTTPKGVPADLYEVAKTFFG